MSWQVIWAAIQSLITGLSHTDKWKMSINDVHNEPITGVHVGPGGIRFEFTAGGKPVSLEALPSNADHAAVKVNGTLQPDAKLVFTLKHQPFKPLIVVLDFRDVVIDGATAHYRFDNPK